MPKGALRSACAVVFATLAAAAPASAQDIIEAEAEIEVDLELVLAVDVSVSTTYEERITQRRGYVEAFRHADVVHAIRAGALGRIAVTYLEWSGADYQEILVPWTVIDSPESADVFIDLLEDVPMSRQHTTSISEALLFSANLIVNNRYLGERRVIDISGDGPNNAGRRLVDIRQVVINRGITINGLPVVIRRDDPWLNVFEGGVASYYRDCVVGGDGALLVPVTSIADFSDAIRYKLILEIAGLQPEEPALVVPVQAPPPPRGPADCAMTEPPLP